MNISKLKLFSVKSKIVIPSGGIDGKNVCIPFISENSSFTDTFRYLSIPPRVVRYNYIPSLSRPKIIMSPIYKKRIIEHGILPVKGSISDYSSVMGRNFYLDFNYPIQAITRNSKVTKFNTGRPMSIVYNMLNAIDGVPSEQYERILIYSVNLEKPISKNFLGRKSYPIYKILSDTQVPPFDKLILHFYDHSVQKFVLLYDKNQPKNLSKIKKFLTVLNSIDEDNQNESDIDDLADAVSNEIINLSSDKEKNKLKDSIRSLLDSNPAIKGEELDSADLAITAVAYNAVGDIDKAITISKKLKNKDENVKKVIVKNNISNLLPKPKVNNTAMNDLVRFAKPEDLVDHQVPVHILEKRKHDFSEQMMKDFKNIFKPLETGDIPIKFKSVKLNTIKSPVSELKQSIKDKYSIQLVEENGNIHSMEVELPHLTENGTFLVNGQPKVLVSQMVLYPIFFLKPYFGKIESEYSAITVYSKRLSKASYLMVHVTGYKIPLIMLLAHKYGFNETMRLFGVKYKVTKERQNEESIKLPNNIYISFNSTSEVGDELIESFNKSIPEFPKSNVDIESKEFWGKVIVNEVGTRNALHLLSEVWRYILTPITMEVLKSKGDPTKLPEILKYISEKVIHGYVDDRNTIEKQRVRTSELFIHILQKQIIAAYNEFKSKKLGGDESARIELNPRKAFSEVVNSQNVQLLESINPLEEISMMTRVTPVGVGGVPSLDAFPNTARNIHHSYYGSIDPLDTPDSETVGILQHLTVGAALTNVRGMFGVKDRKNIKKSEILGTGPAMVPFVNSNDGNRVMMGVGQSRQAVPLLNTEAPAIQSGYEGLLTGLLSDNFIKKAPVDGIVETVTEHLMIIKDRKTGKTHPIDLRSRLIKSGQGKHGLSIFKTSLKEGSLVKQNQIIAEGGGMKDGLIANGRNLLTAVMPWKGFNFEDGVVVSERAASKFTATTIEEESIYLKDEEDIVFITTQNSFLKKGDILLTYSNEIYDVESFRHIRMSGDGEISGIEVYCNVEEEKIPEKLKPAFERFREEFTTLNGEYPIGSFKEKGEIFNGILIKFLIKQNMKLIIGDKMNNRHGNKGVVAIVEKEENMPITPWGERAEIIINPIGIINRMNNGQLLEIHTGLISKKLGDLIIELPREKYVTIFSRTMTLLDGTDNKEYSRNLIQKMKSISDTQYNRVVEQIRRIKFVPIIIPPFKAPSSDNIHGALQLLGLDTTYYLDLPEFNSKTKNKVAVGYCMFQRLEHWSEKKRAARGIGAYVSKGLAPTQGKKRGGGQKVGESDLYSLLGWDVPYVIDELYGSLSSDHPTKNEMVSEIVQTGSTEWKEAKTNPVKDILSQMLLALHLESD